MQHLHRAIPQTSLQAQRDICSPARDCHADQLPISRSLRGQLRLVGLRLLDARRRLVELAREVRLLRLRLTDLLIAERLLVRLLRGLLRELGLLMQPALVGAGMPKQENVSGSCAFLFSEVFLLQA